MKDYNNPNRNTSKNNHLYCVDENLVNFARKYMESLISYEEIDVEENHKFETEKLLKKIL